MATGDRANKERRSEYTEGFYLIEKLSSGLWRVQDGGIVIEKLFVSLHEAREWCKENPADPETCGKTAFIARSLGEK